MIWPRSVAILATILWALPALAESDSGGSWLKLERLNQESKQELKKIPGPKSPRESEKPTETRERTRLYTQQLQQLESLQKRQQQERATARQQSRVIPEKRRPGRTGTQAQQQRFKKQQQYQLDNARTQQRIRSGLR